MRALLRIALLAGFVACQAGNDTAPVDAPGSAQAGPSHGFLGPVPSVTHDTTLTGKGTPASPLSVIGAAGSGSATFSAITDTGPLGVSGTSTLGGVTATSLSDSGPLILTGSIAPTALAGSVNNYAPCDVTTPANCLATTNLVRQDASVASTVTGLAAQASGQAVALLNISAANSITLTNEDTNSTAANRFTLPNGASWVIPPGGAVLLRYSSATSRWRPEHSNNNNVMATAFANSGPETETGYTNLTGLTGTVNDWAPTGFASFKYFLLTTSGAFTVTGIAGGQDGRVIVLLPDSTNGATITFNHESSSSIAANRIQLPGAASASLSIGATFGWLMLRYNGPLQRWQTIGYFNTSAGYSFTVNGSLTSNGTVVANAALQLSFTNTPAQLSATNVDWAPTAGFIERATAAAGGSTIASIAMTGAGSNGRTFVLTNVGATDNITLLNDDGATGTAADRMVLDNAASCVLTPNTSITIRYDGTSSRWRPITPCPNSTQNFWAGVQNDSTTGTLNDYALGASATVIKLTNVTQTTLTGIAGGTDGRIVVVERNGSSVVLSSENASSAAANRISGLNGTSSSLSGLNASAFLMYDSTTQRWHEIAVVSTTMPSPIVNGILLGTTASSAALIGNAAASATVPTLIPNQSDTTTGVGADVSGDVSIVIGGVEKFRFGSFATSFGSLTASAANSWKFPNSTASATVPTLVPNSNDATTGVGAQASGNVSLIAAGTEILRATSTGMLAGSAGNKGTIVLSAGTGTHSSIPGTVCVCSDTTAVAAVKCALSAGTLTATGTGTDTVAYICL